MRNQLVGGTERDPRLFVPAAHRFLELFSRASESFEIGQDQLRLDRLHVGNRIEVSRDMDDVFVFEASDDFDDRVDLADVLEKLVSEALALGRPTHETSDVYEFDR